MTNIINNTLDLKKAELIKFLDIIISNRKFTNYILTNRRPPITKIINHTPD